MILAGVITHVGWNGESKLATWNCLLIMNYKTDLLLAIVIPPSSVEE